MIHSISRNNLEQFFPVIRSGLSRALHKTPLGDFWDLESLWEHLVNFEVFAFHQEETGYSGVFSFQQSPKRKGLYFFWSGKDEQNTIPVDYEEVERYLEEAAKHFDCQYIICEGRKGWKTILEPLGFSIDSINYTKEVTG